MLGIIRRILAEFAFFIGSFEAVCAVSSRKKAREEIICGGSDVSGELFDRFAEIFQNYVNVKFSFFKNQRDFFLDDAVVTRFGNVGLNHLVISEREKRNLFVFPFFTSFHRERSDIGIFLFRSPQEEKVSCLTEVMSVTERVRGGRIVNVVGVMREREESGSGRSVVAA